MLLLSVLVLTPAFGATSSLSFGSSTSTSTISNCYSGTTTGITLGSQQTSSVNTYPYYWTLTFAASSGTYCVYDHIYGFQIYGTLSGSTNTYSNAKVYLWPMLIDSTYINCTESGYAGNTGYASTATLASSTQPSYATNTDGGSGNVCGYTAVYGWTGSTDKFTYTIYTNYSLMKTVSSFIAFAFVIALADFASLL